MDVEDKPRPELPAAGTLGVTHEHHGQHNKERRVGQGRERDSNGCNEDNQTENNSKANTHQQRRKQATNTRTLTVNMNTKTKTLQDRDNRDRDRTDKKHSRDQKPETGAEPHSPSN